MNINSNKNPFASKITDALNQTSDLHVSGLKELTNIEVIIDPDRQLYDFAEAYLYEVSSRNPLTLDQVDLRLDELVSYFKFLIQTRVMYCSDESKPYPQYIQQFYVPCWIEMLITNIGKVHIMDRSLRIVPKVKKFVNYKLDEMSKISYKLERLKHLVGVVRSAFTKVREGDVSTMSFALISNELRSVTKIVTPVYEYMAYFLQLQLNDPNLGSHYRVTYDPINYINDKLRSVYNVVVGDRPEEAKTVVVTNSDKEPKFKQPSGKSFISESSKEGTTEEIPTKDKA